MEYALRPTTETDAPFLAELFADVRGSEFRLGGIPEPMIEQLLTMQHRAQTMSYAAQFPAAIHQVVWIGENRAGRVLVDYGATEIRLIDIALLTRYRGLGVGSMLLRQLCSTAQASDRRLRLSVRPGSRAAQLYERMDFIVVSADETSANMEWRG
jgi:ribosomal protein S18 acetylase RimI-like enzyme